MGSRKRNIILGERWAIGQFLRQKAKNCRRLAENCLSDSEQNRPCADRLRYKASALEKAADEIDQGAHWR